MKRTFALFALILTIIACGAVPSFGDEGEAEAPAADTVEPAESDISEPTAEPENGQGASPTEVNQQTDEEATAQCSHPYFPIVEDAVWEYRGNVEGSEPSEYTITYTNVTDESFTFMQTLDDGTTIESGWRCDGQSIVQLEYGGLTFGGGGLDLEIETISADGITFPPPSEFQPGAEWQVVYEIAINVQGLGEQQGTVTINYTYTGDETVTVPAGEFNAARIEQVLTLSIGDIVTEDFDLVAWHAEGVGRVGSEYTGDFSGFSVAGTEELVSYSGLD